MEHIERHLGKTADELVIRLLQDWKLYSGCLFDGMEVKIEDKLSKLSFNFIEQDILTLQFNELVGVGYNRKFEEMKSYFVKVVVSGTNKDFTIITAYPDLEKGFNTRRKFKFENSNVMEKIISSCKNRSSAINLWNTFILLVKSNCDEVRFVGNKNPYIKFSNRQCILKIKHNSILVTDLHHMEKGEVVYDLSCENVDNILSIINAASKFEYKHTFLGCNNIFENIECFI